jgi:hypothetical protein
MHPSPEMILSPLAALAALVIVAGALLRGWHGWLAFKTRELEVRPAPRGADEGAPGMTARIELADLKERIRKLEAIAAGVDL